MSISKYSNFREELQKESLEHLDDKFVLKSMKMNILGNEFRVNYLGNIKNDDWIYSSKSVPRGGFDPQLQKKRTSE